MQAPLNPQHRSRANRRKGEKEKQEKEDVSVYEYVYVTHQYIQRSRSFATRGQVEHPEHVIHVFARTSYRAKTHSRGSEEQHGEHGQQAHVVVENDVFVCGGGNPQSCYGCKYDGDTAVHKS